MQAPQAPKQLKTPDRKALFMAKFSAKNAAEMGRKGGQATVERHGREHMARIGVRGFWKTAEKHWNGNPGPMVNFLIALGRAATDPVPNNKAFEHNRETLRRRALMGALNLLRPHWKPPPIPSDLDIEPPF